jgi:hypothetical protein
MTLEDNRANAFVEYRIWSVKDEKVTVTFYGKLTATGTVTTLPSVGLYSRRYIMGHASEELDAASMASNTDWQTLSVDYTPTYDRELVIRVQAKGGNSSGTGTDQLYWFHDVDLGGSGGGGLLQANKRGGKQ